MRVINLRIMVDPDDKNWVQIIIGFDSNQVVTKRIFRDYFIHEMVIEGKFFTDLVVSEKEE